MPAYWEAAREPRACLAFLLPLVVIYELGTLLLRPGAWPGQRLVAQSWIQHLAAWFGTDAVWVPGAALVLTLVIWQSLSRTPWQVRGRVPLLMLAESLVLTLPLFVLRELLQPAEVEVAGLGGQMVLVLGAGIYEELVFRLYLVSGLMWLLESVCQVPKRAALPTAVVLAALIFAACHLQPIGADIFEWPRFLVLTVAGGYLAVVFVVRGLGVATGCHVAYNLIALALSVE